MGKAETDKFFEKTGVRLIPYRKGMKIKLMDDPKFEKKFPFFSGEALAKISKGSAN